MKTFVFTVTVPGIPDWMPPAQVWSWLDTQLLRGSGHPWDAYYATDVKAEWVSPDFNDQVDAPDAVRPEKESFWQRLLRALAR